MAAAIFVLLLTVPKILGSNHPWLELPIWLIIYGIAALAVVRYGLVVLAIAIVVANILLNVPYTLDFSNWYAAPALCAVLGFIALAIWGFYTALAGQRLWKGERFE